MKCVRCVGLAQQTPGLARTPEACCPADLRHRRDLCHWCLHLGREDNHLRALKSKPTYHLLAFLAAFALGFLAVQFTPSEAANPPSPYQQNPDIYACCGLPSVFAGWTPGDLSTLNPITTKIRAGARLITYSYIVVPGCSDGNMLDNLQIALRRSTEVTHVEYVRVSVGGDAALRATCGTDAANVGVTGGVVGDLYPRWPYETNVNINTIMATYPNITQQSIWCHEFCGGHGVSTWDEQYQKNGTFAPTPGLISMMNTGPDSRYLWPQNDIDRWERTMYPLTVPVECALWAGFDPCTNTVIRADGWRLHLDDGSWYDWLGRRQYDGCNADGYRWSPTQGRWKQPNQPDGFDPALSQWITVPSC